MSTPTPFIREYSQARAAFIQDALDAEADIESYSHYDEKRHSPDLGNDLFTDVATIGPCNAETVVVTSSGIQGIDLFYGSALQRLWIREAAQQFSKKEAPTCFVFVHALNPIGSILKRNEAVDNIDLGRNFFANFKYAPSVSSEFLNLSHFLTPLDIESETIRNAMIQLKLQAQKDSPERFISRLSRGQSSLPKSLFYTGKEPGRGHVIWNSLVERSIMRNAPKKIIHINLRSGLGPWGKMRVLPASAKSPYATQMVYGTAYVSGIPALCDLVRPCGNIIDYWPHLNRIGAEIAPMTLEIGVSNEEGWDALRATIKRHALSVRYRDEHKDKEKIIDQFEATFCPRHRKWEEAVMDQGGRFFSKLAAHL